MPPVAAMQVSIAGYDGTRLRLHAPLARNVNDKGCAFGGSLASLMTLASWGLVALRVQAAGLEADVFVADSQVRYLAPLFADLEAEAELAADASGTSSSPPCASAAAPAPSWWRGVRAARRRRRGRRSRARYVAIGKG